MPVSRDVVEHVAQLAHIGLQPGEVEALTEQLSSVIDHVARLREVDTEGVLPTAQIVPTENVMRDDEVVASWLPIAVLANARHTVDDLFAVQAIL